MEDCHLWIALCILMKAAISQASQDISTHTGENLTIPCPIQVDSDLRILYWRKNGKTIYYSGENSNGNYSVTDTTSLVISDVSNGDAGNYSCRVVFLSLETVESDVIEVYVTDLTVSHCSSSQQGSVDDCSCHVDGTNVTSLVCTASGFPYSPAIQWTHNGQTVGFSSTDLKQFQDNVTLICNAWDRNVVSIVSAEKTVCIFYKNDVRPSQPAKPAIPRYAIALIIVLLLALITFIIVLLVRYKRKKGQSFYLPKRCPFSSCSGFSKSTGGREDVKFEQVQQGMNMMKKDKDDTDFLDISKDCNNDVKAWKKAEMASPMVEHDPVDDMPLVGRVLLDDLRASNEESKVALKRAIDWLMRRRVQLYKKYQPKINASGIKSSVRSMNQSMQGSVIMDTSGNRDVTYVAWVLKQLDRIRDPTDRDECEILITKPDFQAMTDESQIPEYTGKIINVSIGGYPAMSSTLNRSIPERNELSDVILAELQTKSPQERTATRNEISQIILEFIRKGQGHNSMIDSSEGFVHSNCPLPSYEDLLDKDSRLVALWTSKIAKLDDDVEYSITDYLFTPKSSIPNESSAGLKEEGSNETLKSPSLENLPKDNNERVQID